MVCMERMSAEIGGVAQKSGDLENSSCWETQGLFGVTA